MLTKKPILKKKWYEEACEFLEFPPRVIKNLQKDSAAQKIWLEKYPRFEDHVNSSQRLVDKKIWVDQWRKNYGMIVSGDRIAFHRWWRRYLTLIKWLQARLRSDATILDYGCGTSFFCRLMSEYMPSAEYILVDIKAPSLDYACERCKLFAQRVSMIGIDEKNMAPPLPEADFIFCKDVMEHLWYPDVAIDNFHKSLRTGGMLTVNFPGGAAESAFKNDTQRSYELRDQNILTMYRKFFLLRGREYVFKKGYFKNDGQLKVWRRADDKPTYSITT